MLQQANSQESFSKLYSEYLENSDSSNEIRMATVTAVDKKRRLVYLNAGLRSEGCLSADEFAFDGLNIDDIKVGDTFEVFVSETPNYHGAQQLSRQKSIKVRRWKQFEKCFQNNELVYGVIIGCVKGGFAVDLNGLIGFLPGSQVDVRPIKNPILIKNMMNKILPFGILKMDYDNGNIVLSYKVIIEQQRHDQRSKYLSQIQVGSVVRGVVKSVAPYGAFVDLGPLDGLLHITDMKWSKVTNSASVVSIGQEVDVMVIKYDPEAQRVSLSLKHLHENPWEKLKERFAPGSRYRGKVTSVADYGAFVSINYDSDVPESERIPVDGLVYRFEINWFAMNAHPSRFVQVGDEVEVVVLELDIAKHRLSLSMKRCSANPWEEFKAKHPVGSKIKAYITKVLKYGVCASLSPSVEAGAGLDIFVPMPEVVESLIPNLSAMIQESANNESNQDGSHNASLQNQEIEVMIRAIYPLKERIVCSMRAIDPDAVAMQVGELANASYLESVISDVDVDGVTVEIKNGPVGFVPVAALEEAGIPLPTAANIGSGLPCGVALVGVDPSAPYRAICKAIPSPAAAQASSAG